MTGGDERGILPYGRHHIVRFRQGMAMILGDNPSLGQYGQFTLLPLNEMDLGSCLLAQSLRHTGGMCFDSASLGAVANRDRLHRLFSLPVRPAIKASLSESYSGSSCIWRAETHRPEARRECPSNLSFSDVHAVVHGAVAPVHG